jgi:hypothetical protein
MFDDGLCFLNEFFHLCQKENNFFNLKINKIEQFVCVSELIVLQAKQVVTI